ncbi:uncharacterized protein LOC143209032 [Lasioglossum baleicum]|uniref:uncharacterized protein LOC143209032 n=1 Tax=Lasioglossum baleicum TaxID=434251 RepID=UPI003FCD96F1
MSTHKKGQTVHSEARNMVRRVIKKCDEESEMGVSKRTVYRIRQESSDSGEGMLQSPGKKRPRASVKFQMSNEDKEVIKNIIHDLYTVKKIVPTGSNLLAATREKIEFPWKRTTFYDLLHSMGFRWRRCNNVRRVLIEKPNIVAWRGKYLKAIQYHRREGRNIIYIDETWVDNTLSFGKCWQSEQEMGILQNQSSSHRLIIVHAGGKNGFITDASLIFKSRTTTGDYHGQMNSTNFEKWIREKLIPNLPADSVVVMDNASYHTVQTHKTPNKYCKKSTMIDWLADKNIPYTVMMRKFELMQLIDVHKPVEKTYKVDELLKSHGFHVLRLPPYMCELNPIELAWAEIKNKIRSKNVGTLSFAELQNLTQEAIAEISPSMWEKYCRHVESNEKKYWERDALMEEILDDITFIEENDSDSDDSSSSEND